jgi:hypothetical protein
MIFQQIINEISIHCLNHFVHQQSRPECSCILRHVDLLLGNDHKIRNYTMAVTRQWPVRRNAERVFFVQSAPRCYKQEGFNHVICCCEKLAAEAGDSSVTRGRETSTIGS